MGGSVSVAEEVVKLLEILKSAGFEPVDATFRGSISVLNKSTLEFIDKLVKEGEAAGTLVVVYRYGDGIRMVEIPVGSLQNPDDSTSGQ